MTDAEKINLLKDSLELYIEKWDMEKENTEKQTDLYKLNSLCFLARWIINSINGGLDKAHATNICKIMLNME